LVLIPIAATHSFRPPACGRVSRADCLDLFLDGLRGALDRLVELPLLLLVGGLPQGLPDRAEAGDVARDAACRIRPLRWYSGCMTVTLTVRLPDDVHQRVRESADANRRSLNSEIVVLLERGLGCDDEAGR
jgi:hypothetical protein